MVDAIDAWVDVIFFAVAAASSATAPAELKFENKVELLQWFDEDGIPKEEQEEIEIQMLEDYTSKLRGRAKCLGGGRDPWREPQGGLPVSQ